MAKDRKKLGSNNAMELPELDLDWLNDDLDDMPGSSKVGPVREFMSGFKRGFLNKVTATQILTRTIRMALPPGYTRAIGATESLINASKEVASELRTTHARELLSLTKTAEQKLPKLRNRLSGKLYGKIESRIKNLSEGLDQEVKARDWSADKEQIGSDDALIAGVMGDLAGVQADIAKAQESAEQERFEIEQTERNVQAKTSQLQFDLLSRQLGRIAGDLSSQTAFQDQITYVFQRKSLEVQYRSLFMLRDLRKLSEASLETHKEAFNAIIRNTSLPEHEKVEYAEKTRFGLRNDARHGVVGRMGRRTADTLPDFLANYYPEIQKNITRSISDTVSSIVPMFSMVGSSAGMMSRSDMINEAGSLAGSGALRGGGWLASLLGASRLRSTMANLDDRTGGLGDRLSYLTNNAPSLIRDWANDFNHPGMVGGFLRSMVRGVMPSFHMNDRIDEGSYQNIDRQVSFNQLTQRSIVEIIPGYLSRILHEARIARTGDVGIEREVYDITAGKFVGYDTAKASILRRIMPEHQRRNIATTLDSIMGGFGERGDLSPAAQNALRERLLRDASTGGRFDAAQYAQGGYASSTADATLDELRGFFQNAFQFDESGKLINNLHNNRLQEMFSNEFLQLRDIAPDPRGELRRLNQLGVQEITRDLGLMGSYAGTDRVDLDKVWSIYSKTTMDLSESGSLPQDYRHPVTDEVVLYGREIESGSYVDVDTGKTITKLEDITGDVADTNGRVVITGRELTRGVVDMSGGKVVPPNLKAEAANIMGWFNRQRDRATSAMRSRFGKELDQAADYAEQARDYVGERASPYVDRARDLVDKFPDVKSMVTDEVILSGRAMELGKYVDAGTGAVIRRVEDITGDVKDLSGRTVATAIELAQGLKDHAGKAINLDGVKKRYRSHLESLGTLGSNVQETMRKRFTETKDVTTDLYIKGRDHAVLLARDLRNGQYKDQLTGKVITSLEDIKGTVVDLSDNVVVTAGEIKDGLVDKLGLRVRVGNIVDRVRDGGLAGAILPGVSSAVDRFRAARSHVTSAYGRVKAWTDNKFHDLFLPNDESNTPRIRASDVSLGKYIDQATQRVIKTVDDVKGAIIDRDGNTVATPEELAEATTVSGEKHPVAKRGIIRRLVGWGLRTAGRTAFGAIKGAVKFGRWYGRKVAAPYYKWLGKKVLPKWLTGEGRASEAEKAMEGMEPRDQLLSRILGVLSSRLPKPEPRKGSWQERLARQSEDTDKDDDGDDKTPGSKSWLASLGAGIAGLLGFGGGKSQGDDEDDEDDGGNTYIGIDAGGDGDGKKKKRKRGKKPKGRLGRAWHATKNMGRGVGRFLMNPFSSTARLGLNAARFGLMGGLKLGAMALGAIGSALSTPIVIGAAVVGAAAVGGYMYYRKRKRAAGLFREYRLAQYGFSNKGWSKAGKLLDLEDICRPLVHHAPGEVPTMNINPRALDEIAKLFGVKESSSPEKTEDVANWLMGRFKPVFLAYHAALKSIAPNITLEELDDKIPEELGMQFFEAVQFDYEGDTPYIITASPFGTGNKTQMTIKDIQSKEKKIIDRYKDHAGKEDKEDVKELEAAQTTVDRESQSNAARISGTVGAVTVASLSSVDLDEVVSVATGRRDPATGTIVASTLAALPGGKVARSITILETVRMKAYGVERLTQGLVRSLISLEELTLPRVRFDSNHTASFDGSINNLVDEMATLFGIRRDTMSPVQQEWRTWLEYRFLPAFLNFLSGSKLQDASIGVGISPSRMESRLSSLAKAEVAKAIIAAKYDDRSIWEISTIPFTDRTDPQILNQLEESARSYLALLEQIGASELAEVDVPYIAPTTSTDEITEPGSRRSPSSDVSSIYSPAPSAPQIFRPTSRESSGRAVGTVALGNVFSGLTSGTGGAWETIPFPSSNRSLEAARATFAAVGKMVGISPGLLATFAMIESAMDYRARNDHSSAGGWFQFIDSTWNEMLQKYARRFGLPERAEAEGLKFDPRANALMGGLFLKDNFSVLESKLGRAPTDTDLYLAHFFGPAGAVKFLEADSNALASRLFPQAATANRAIFFHPSGRPRSVAEIYALMNEKVAKARRSDDGFNLLSSANADTFVEPSSTTTDPEVDYATPVSSTPPRRPPLATRTNRSLGPITMAGGTHYSPTDTTVESTHAGLPYEDQPDPVHVAQAEQRRRAEEADRRQQQQVVQSMVSSRQVHNVLDNQLKVQEGMLGYLKEIAERLGVDGIDGLGGNDRRERNDTSRPPESRREHLAGTTPPPISMRYKG